MSASQGGRPPDSGLDLPRDPHWQRLSWRVERLGWWGFLLIILAGMAGLFGDGPLSRATLQSADGRLTVVYPRIARRQAESLVHLTVRTPAAARTVRVWFAGNLLDRAELDEVLPEPARMIADGPGLAMVFERQPGAAPLRVLLHLRVRGPGRHDGEVRLDGGAGLLLRQWVLP